MAQTLSALGSEAAWLVHGHDGTDELSIAGPSNVVTLYRGRIETMEITPEDAGLPRHPFEQLIGGTPEHNAVELRRIFAGQGGAYRDAVLLNAAAALLMAENVGSLAEGVERAAQNLDNGRAQATLEALAAFTSTRQNDLV